MNVRSDHWADDAQAHAAATAADGPRASALPFDPGAVFQASPNPYVVFAPPDFTIVAANRAYLRTTGRSAEEILGRSLFDAFPGGSPHDPERQGERELRASLERVVRERKPATLALIRYAIPRCGGDEAFEDRYWSAVHTPLLDARGEVAFILQHTVDVTELQTLRQMAAAGPAPLPDARPAPGGGDEAERVDQPVVTVFRRAQEVQEANRVLAAEHHHLRQFFEQAPGFMALLSGPDHVFELVNRAYVELIGHRDVVGKPVQQALPEVEEQGFVALLDHVYASGRPFVGYGMSALLQRRPDAPREERFIDFVFQPVTGADGTVAGIFVQGNDVTERQRGEERQRLLLDELNHRVKNTLAVVQSIASQTARNSETVEAFRQAFLARVIALSHTHDALTRGRFEGADLRDLLDRELAPYGADRIALRGGEVRLPPRVAVALGMVFHELATNAAKHGALSAPAGHLDVAWWTEPGDGGDASPRALALDWIEEGGAPVSPPARRGFGFRLIERSVRRDLGGEARLDFRPEGLRGHIRIPLPPGLRDSGGGDARQPTAAPAGRAGPIRARQEPDGAPER